MSELSAELRWLMDRAAERGAYVRLVLPETMDQVAQWNAPCPRWRSRDVFAALYELERMGWIRFFIYNDEEDEVPVIQPTFNHQALIDAFRLGKQALFYRLTDAGAVVWEQIAKPNWNLRYDFEVREAASQDEEGECVITAMTEEIARQALLTTACTQSLIVIPGSERYAPCGPWKATYWKKMDFGFQATAAVGSVEYARSLLPLASQRRCGEYAQSLAWWYAPIDEPHWQRREYLEHGGMWDNP